MKILSLSAIAGLLAAIALPSLALEPKPSCQALETWAAGLQQLPTDYESYSELSLVQRKAVYSRFSSAERATLWQRHWQEALQQGSWTAEQKALLVEAGRLMNAETFAALAPREGERYAAARASVDAFSARVKNAFPKNEITALFYRLGTPAAIPEAGLAFRCYCNSGFDDCDPGFTCDPSGCQIRLFGCGMYYEEVCDGECFLI